MGADFTKLQCFSRELFVARCGILIDFWHRQIYDGFVMFFDSCLSAET
jgi:hypothetical protein